MRAKVTRMTKPEKTGFGHDGLLVFWDTLMAETKSIIQRRRTAQGRPGGQGEPHPPRTWCYWSLVIDTFCFSPVYHERIVPYEHLLLMNRSPHHASQASLVFHMCLTSLSYLAKEDSWVFYSWEAEDGCPGWNGRVPPRLQRERDSGGASQRLRSLRPWDLEGLNSPLVERVLGGLDSRDQTREGLLRHRDFLWKHYRAGFCHVATPSAITP